MLSGPPSRGLATRIDTLTGFNGSTAQWATTSKAEYDALGRPVKSYDGLDRATTTGYTPATGGLVTQTVVTNPAGHTITTTLDPNRGLPLTVVDANGKTTAGRLRRARPADQGLAARPHHRQTPDTRVRVHRAATTPSARSRPRRSARTATRSPRSTSTTGSPEPAPPRPPPGRQPVDRRHRLRLPGPGRQAVLVLQRHPPNGHGVTYTDASVTTQTGTSYDGAARPADANYGRSAP